MSENERRDGLEHGRYWRPRDPQGEETFYLRVYPIREAAKVEASAVKGKVRPVHTIESHDPPNESGRQTWQSVRWRVIYPET